MGVETRLPAEGSPAPDASESAPVESRSASPPPEPGATASDLPDFAEKAYDLDAIKKAVDDAASVSGGLWLSYLFVLFYLAIAAGAVTHVDLFLENPVKLPFLGIDLPLLAFFFVAPILFVIVHAYTLVHLVMLTDKAKRYDESLDNQIKESGELSKDELARRAAIHAGLRQQLPSNIFVLFLAGPEKLRKSLFGWLLRAIGWVTLVIAPILLLLLMQVQFLPFHSSFITWTQRIVLVADLILLWWLWSKILSGRETATSRPVSKFAWGVAGLALTASAVIFSWAVATFPGEWQEDGLTRWHFGDRVPSFVDWLLMDEASLHDHIFNSEVNPTTRRRWLPFSSTLVLPGMNVFESLGIDDPKKTEWRDFVFRARGRDLRGARFDFAVLRKIDFDGAQLRSAKLYCTQLQGASLRNAELQDALLDCAQLQGASVTGAELQRATLVNARLQGATLDDAHLQEAFLIGADLQGTSLQNSQLQLARLDLAQLQGAALRGAKLQRASLENAQLQGASLDRAQLQNASLIGARLQGASFNGAQLQGATLDGAQLQELTPTQLAKALAAELKALVCFNGSDPIYVLRGLLSNNQLASSGSEAPALIDFILSKDCPVAAALTDADKGNLLSIKQDAEKVGK